MSGLLGGGVALHATQVRAFAPPPLFAGDEVGWVVHDGRQLWVCGEPPQTPGLTACFEPVLPGTDGSVSPSERPIAWARALDGGLWLRTSDGQAYLPAGDPRLSTASPHGSKALVWQPPSRAPCAREGVVPVTWEPESGTGPARARFDLRSCRRSIRCAPSPSASSRPRAPTGVQVRLVIDGERRRAGAHRHGLPSAFPTSRDDRTHLSLIVGLELGFAPARRATRWALERSQEAWSRADPPKIGPLAGDELFGAQERRALERLGCRTVAA